MASISSDKKLKGKENEDIQHLTYVPDQTQKHKSTKKLLDTFDSAC